MQKDMANGMGDGGYYTRIAHRDSDKRGEGELEDSVARTEMTRFALYEKKS